MEDAKGAFEQALGLQLNAFSLYNGFVRESVGDGRTSYRLEIGPNSKNPYGMVHGGALYAMADDTAGTAAHTDGRHYVTQSGTLHFLCNQPSGVIRARAVIRHRGRATALADVEITNEKGDVLALGEFTYFCVDKGEMDARLRKESAKTGA